MIEIIGDFWEEYGNKEYDAIVCTINQEINSAGNLIMGKGIALEFKKRYPYLPSLFGERIVKGQVKIPLVIHHCTEPSDLLDDTPYEDVYIVGLPTKMHWKYDSPEELVIDNCQKLKFIADFMDWTDILMTRPGCGNGNLDWHQLKTKLNLDNRFKVISNE